MNESEAGEFTAWRRVDPRTLIVHLLPVLVVLALFLGPVLVASGTGIGFGTSDGAGRGADASGSGAPAGDLVNLLIPFLGVAGVAIRWYTGRYAIVDGAVRWRVGLVVHRSTDIALDRIQDVEVTRPLVPRMVGLSQVTVSSAGGAGEIKLHYLDRAVAERLGRLLQAEIATHRRLAAGQGVPTAATGTPGGADPSALAPAVEIHHVAAAELWRWAWYRSWPVIPLLILVGMVAAFVDWRAALPILPAVPFWVIGVARPLLDRTNMRVSIDATSLFTVEGLTTLRRTSTQRERVQLVESHQRWLQRHRGGETVRFASADVTLQRNETTVRDELALDVPADTWGTMAATIAHRQVIGPAWLRSKPAAVWRVCVARWSVVGAFVGLVAAVVVGITVSVNDSIDASASGAVAFASFAVPAVAGALFGVVRGRSRHRVEGWAVSPEDLLIRRGLIQRRTMLVFASKTQSVEVVSGPLQRRLGLVSVQVDVAPPGRQNRVVIADVAPSDADELRTTLVAAGSRPLSGGV